MPQVTIDIDLSNVRDIDVDQHLLNLVNAARRELRQQRIAARDWPLVRQLSRGNNLPTLYARIASNRLTQPIPQSMVLGIQTGESTFRNRTWNEMPIRRTINGEEYCALLQPAAPVAPIDLGVGTLPPAAIAMADGIAGIDVLTELPE